MESYSDAEHVNVGTGVDITIRELAETLRAVIYPEVNLVFDPSKPDGMPRKALDVSKLRDLGWSPRIEFADGLRDTYEWFLAQPAGAIRGLADAVVAG